MKRKKIGIITICVLLFLGAMIFIVIRNGQRKDKEAIVEDTEKEQYAVTYVWPKNDLTEKIPEPKSKNGAVLHADDQTKAYKKAEKEMEKTAANDTVLLAQAQQRVQSMLEDYVKNMGTMLGKEYTITWDIKENHVKSDTAESTE